ncbi:unnamed protein product, partial [Ectocarpus sp. 8 AP-2014]
AGSRGSACPQHGQKVGYREGGSAGVAEGSVGVLRHGGLLLPASSVARAGQRPLQLPGPSWLQRKARAPSPC